MKQYSLHEVKTKKEYHAFFTFPFTLYKGCDQWVPPITSEEKAIFNRTKNPVFENADAKLYVVKNGKQIVGRIAALINWIEVKEQAKTKVRFGWYDTIDDLDVSRMLIDAVHFVGKAKWIDISRRTNGFFQYGQSRGFGPRL